MIQRIPYSIRAVAFLAALLVSGLLFSPVNGQEQGKLPMPPAPSPVPDPTPPPNPNPQPPLPVVITISLQASLTGDVGDILQLPAVTNGLNVRWIVSDPGLQMIPPAVLKDSRIAILIGKRPGVYKVWAYTAQADMPSDPAYCTVTIVGFIPPLPPVPPIPVPPTPVPPGPTPPGPVTKTNAYVLAIVDHAKIPVSVAQILSAVGPEIDGKGHKWRELEVTNPVISDRGYAKSIQMAGGAPCILIIDFQNKLLKASPFPSDKQALLKLVADVTGN